MSAHSAPSSATRASVVACSVCAPTAAATISSKPRSTTGLLPRATALTLSTSMSTPHTSWPAFAIHPADTVPAYPSPNTATFIEPRFVDIREPVSEEDRGKAEIQESGRIGRGAIEDADACSDQCDAENEA